MFLPPFCNYVVVGYPPNQSLAAVLPTNASPHDMPEIFGQSEQQTSDIINDITEKGASTPSNSDTPEKDDKNRDTIHTCMFCYRPFSRKGNLQRHIRSHFGIKPFQCKECSKTFSTKSNMKTHEVIHQRQTHYDCQFCGRVFKRVTFYQRHVSAHEEKNDPKESESVEKTEKSESKSKKRRRTCSEKASNSSKKRSKQISDDHRNVSSSQKTASVSCLPSTSTSTNKDSSQKRRRDQLKRKGPRLSKSTGSSQPRSIETLHQPTMSARHRKSIQSHQNLIISELDPTSLCNGTNGLSSLLQAETSSSVGYTQAATALQHALTMVNTLTHSASPHSPVVSELHIGGDPNMCVDIPEIFDCSALF
jgi:hypothetical protein